MRTPHEQMRHRILAILIALVTSLYILVQPSGALPVQASWINWTGGENSNAGSIPWHSSVGFSLSSNLGISVDTVTGNLQASYSPPSLPGVAGMDQSVALRYNSFDRGSVSNIGYGWGLNMSGNVGLDITQPNQATLVDGSGKTWTFTKSGGVFTSPPGIDADLVQNGDGTYTLTAHSSRGKLQFNSYGYLTSVQDRTGNTITFTYAGTNWVGTTPFPADITNTEGQSTTFHYGSGNATSLINGITEPGGSVTTLYPNGTSKNLTGVNQNDGVLTATGFNYDANHDLTKITDRLGNITLITYANGGAGPAVASVTRVTNTQTMTGPTWSFAYSSGSTIVTDPNSHTTTYGFDGSGRVTSVTYPDLTSSQRSWTSDNQIASETSPRGNTTGYSYDALNRLTKITLPAITGVSMTSGCAYTNSTFPYQATSCSDEQGRTTSFGFNGQGLVNQVTGPDNTSSSVVYNSNGTVASSNDQNGNTTASTYQTNGLPKQDTPPAPLGTTQYAFNGSNLESSVTDGNGKLTTFSYNNAHILTGIGYSDSTSIGYSVDGNGNLLAMTDASGTTNYTYNSLNELTQEKKPNGQTITYAYDAVGNLVNKTDSGGTITYGYNQNDQVTSVLDRGNKSYSLGYDADGSGTSITFPNGITQTSSFNAVGQLTSTVASGCTAGTCPSFSYSYTNPSTNQPTLTPYSMTDAAGNTTSFSYDIASQLTGAIKKASGGATVATYGFGYDNAGNLTSKSINGTSTTFGYNAANELTSATGGMNMTYSYNGVGDRTGSSDGTSINLNAAGQITSITPPHQSAIPYTYTGQGEQQRTGNGSTSYQYDGTGLAVLNGSLGSTTFTTLPDGGLLAETIPSGPSAGSYYYLDDGAGNVAALTDSAGAVRDSYSYDPLGNATSTGAVPNPFTFQGGMFDVSTGYYYTGSGYYDPATGQSFGCRDHGKPGSNVDSSEDACGEDESGGAMQSATPESPGAPGVAFGISSPCHAVYTAVWGAQHTSNGLYYSCLGACWAQASLA